MKKFIDNQIFEIQEIIRDSRLEITEMIEKIVLEILICIRKGNKILLCGNGGSAADSQHFSAELMSGMKKNDLNNPVAAVALTTDTSFITAYSNDYNFEEIFSRQILALGQTNDVLIIFSTSGESTNCIRAAEAGEYKNMKIISFTKKNSELHRNSHLSLALDCDTPHMQEMHVISYHIISRLIIENLKLDNVDKILQ